MADQIVLVWRPFSVNIEKANAYFKAHLSANYDGLVCTEDNMLVNFFDTVSEGDAGIVSTYWDNSTPTTFAPTLQEIINIKINQARVFGNDVIVKAAVENVAMGITQAGKTKAVADLFANLQYYLTTGSLYAAVAELQRIIDAGLDPNLAPFVTEARLLGYKSQIETYLAS